MSANKPISRPSSRPLSLILYLKTCIFERIIVKLQKNMQKFVSMHKQSLESVEKYSISAFSAYYRLVAVYHKISYFDVKLV